MLFIILCVICIVIEYISDHMTFIKNTNIKQHVCHGYWAWEDAEVYITYTSNIILDFM